MSARARALRAAAFALAAALLGVVGGCGGSDSTAPPPVGDPVSATVGAAGGSVAFTASGVQGTLEFPAGALSADTVVTVTPLAPAGGEWTRLGIEGPAGLLPEAATVTLRLGETPGARAAGVRVADAGAMPLAYSVGADGRSLVLRIQDFGSGGAAAAASPARRQALAARPMDAASAPPSIVAARRDLTPAERIDALRESIERHERENAVESGLQANLSVAALGMNIDAEDPAVQRTILDALEDASRRACARLSQVMAIAQSTPVPANLNQADVNESRRWILTVVGPVLYWQAVVMKLGADPCAGLNVEAVLNAKFGELLAWVRAKERERHDPAGFQQMATTAPESAELADHARILEAPRLRTVVTANFVEPVMVPLRASAWTTEAATQAHYLLVFSQLSLYAGPFRDDVQMVRTQLAVDSRDGTGSAAASLGSGAGGRGASPDASVKEITVPARAGGRVDVTGPIAVLNCPGAARERLVIDFEGVTVLDRPSVGDKLLDSTQSFATSSLLAAAGIATTTEGTHVLEVRRVGSSCNTTFGTGDAALMRIRLDFLAGKPPPPPRITGKTFSGTMVEYYMPHDSGCDRGCLDRNPGSDRCPVMGYYSTTLSAIGDPSAYVATLRRRHSTVPPDTPPIEEIYDGRGDDHSFSGYWRGPPGPTVVSMSFFVNESGTLTGTIRYQCHLLEMSLAAPPN